MLTNYADVGRILRDVCCSPQRFEQGVRFRHKRARHDLPSTKARCKGRWLRHTQDVQRRHRTLVGSTSDGENQLAVPCELNVVEQAVNVCRASTVQGAWRKGLCVSAHGWIGWIYSLRDGLLVDLEFSAAADEAMDSAGRRCETGPRAIRAFSGNLSDRPKLCSLAGDGRRTSRDQFCRAR